MQFPIVIGLRRSRLVDGALAVLTTVALFAIAGVPWPLQIALPIAGALILLAFHAAYRLAPPLKCLRIEADGKISGRPTGQAGFLPLRLLPGAAVHPWLTVLRLDGKGRAYWLLIAADSAAPDEFRRLRVCLRWCADVSDGAGDF